MSEQPHQIIIRKSKSNAPVILGIIGFVLGIPAVLCGLLCAGIAGAGAAGAAAEAANPASTIGMDAQAAAAHQAVAQAGSAAAAGVGSVLIILLLCWLGGFVLSFFGKSSFSKTTGLILTIMAAGMLVLSLISINILGAVTAICYAIAGVISINNQKLAE